jgi:hypothetical protein
MGVKQKTVRKGTAGLSVLDFWILVVVVMLRTLR